MDYAAFGLGLHTLDCNGWSRVETHQSETLYINVYQPEPNVTLKCDLPQKPSFTVQCTAPL